MKRIEILGHVGTIKELPKFLAVSICVKDSVKKKDSTEYVEVNTWFNCIFFKKDLSIKVGDKFWVSGDFENSSYESDGEVRIQTKILVNDFKCVYRKQ